MSSEYHPLFYRNKKIPVEEPASSYEKFEAQPVK